MEKEETKMENSLSKRQLRKLKKEANKTNALEVVTEQDKLNAEIQEAYKSHANENSLQTTSTLPAAPIDTRLHIISKLAEPITGLGVQSKKMFKERQETRLKMLKKRVLEAEHLAQKEYEKYVEEEDGKEV